MISNEVDINLTSIIAKHEPDQNYLYRVSPLFSGLSAQENPLWMRYPAISPDGKTIAFCYKGDIFLVSSEGGRATQLTTHPAYDSRPVWSPDGKTIAFTSARDEGLNLYTVPVSGGTLPA